MFSIENAELIDTLFCNYDNITKNDSLNLELVPVCVKNLKTGEFTTIIKQSSFVQLLKLQDADEIDNIFKKCKDVNAFLDLLCTGISSLFLFIQANWTGPSIENVLTDLNLDENGDIQQHCRQKLLIDGKH